MKATHHKLLSTIFRIQEVKGGCVLLKELAVNCGMTLGNTKLGVLELQNSGWLKYMADVNQRKVGIHLNRVAHTAMELAKTLSLVEHNPPLAPLESDDFVETMTKLRAFCRVKKLPYKELLALFAETILERHPIDPVELEKAMKDVEL